MREEGIIFMDPAVYFTLIINVLMVVTFIVLLLIFLYMIYHKEETSESPIV